MGCDVGGVIFFSLPLGCLGVAAPDDVRTQIVGLMTSEVLKCDVFFMPMDKALEAVLTEGILVEFYQR